MSGNAVKWIILFFVCFSLVACDEKASGNSYAGKKSEDCNESNNPNCYDTHPGSSPISGDYDYESYGDGDVVTYQWDRTLAWFLQSKKHPYGYDRDPFSNLEDYIERGKDVYMSVLKGEMAVVNIVVDSEAQKEYRLHRINENKEILDESVVVGTDICSDTGCIKEFSLPAGHYAVYYDGIDKKRYLHVIDYPSKTNTVYFVQFGDEYGNTCNIGNDDGCYTRKNVQENYNRIIAQVVTTGNFVELKPEDIGLTTAGENGKLLLDLNDFEDGESILDKIYEQILSNESFGYGKEKQNYDSAEKNLKSAEQKYDNGEIDVSTYNSAVALYNNAVAAYNAAFDKARSKHIVLGINEMRIRWKEFALPREGSLKLTRNKVFARACQVDRDACESGKMSMMLESSCGDKDIPIKVEVSKVVEDDNFEPKISGFSLKHDCSYTIYADVYPFVPDDPDAAQITVFNHRSETDRSIVGGMVWGSHLNGAASLNTIVHEIGHSFGLTDLYMDSADPSIAPDRYRHFAFDEGNIMAARIPSGERLRYRPLFVVNTGTNDRIPIGDGWFATENQWDCVRSSGKCFKQ